MTQITRVGRMATQAAYERPPVLKRAMVDGILQKSVYEVTTPGDVKINGLWFRLATGTRLSLTSFGADNTSSGLKGWNDGCVMDDVSFVADGEQYVAQAGTRVSVPVPC